MKVQIQKLDGDWLTVSRHKRWQDAHFDAERWATLYPDLPVRTHGRVGTGVAIDWFTKKGIPQNV